MVEYSKKIAFISKLEHWVERTLFQMKQFPETCGELLKVVERKEDGEGQKIGC